LKIGFSEMKNTSSMRLFSFVEGGTFNAENADIGIWVNGLKQLVSLRTLNVIKCHGTHIKISVTDDFQGTGSSDTKLDNVTIQGFSANEDNYGIYIDKSCCDCKISDCFIYGTKRGIYTASAGHIINNVHILSWIAAGGQNNGDGNFKGTEGLHIASGGFFTFNEIYFDTIERDLVIDNVTPSIILDKPISYSYRKGFGSAFIYRQSDYKSRFQLKVTGGNIDIGNKGANYKIFDINRLIIPSDYSNNISFSNNNIRNIKNLYPLDHSMMMRLSGDRSVTLLNSAQPFKPVWNSLGALAPGDSENHLEIRLSDDKKIILRIKYSFEGQIDITKESDIPEGYSLGYMIIDNCCLLLLKPENEITLQPEIIDIDGNSSYLGTPYKDKVYTIDDYTSAPFINII